MAVSQEILDNLVNVGTTANDSSGDDLRDAFIKVNNNLLYIGNRLGESVDGRNVGAAGERVFKTAVGPILEFRKINASDNLSISTISDVIVLKFDPSGAVNFNNQEITNVDILTSNSVSTTDISANTAVISEISGTLYGDSVGIHYGLQLGDQLGSVFSSDGTQLLVDGETGVITGTVVGDIVSSNITGNLTGLVRTTNNNTFVDVNNIENRINIFDYGVINPVFTSSLEYLLYTIGTDMGTFNNPSEFGIDAGNI